MVEFEHGLLFWLIGGSFSFIIGVYLMLSRVKASKSECIIIHRQIEADRERIDAKLETLTVAAIETGRSLARIEERLSAT